MWSISALAGSLRAGVSREAAVPSAGQTGADTGCAPSGPLQTTIEISTQGSSVVLDNDCWSAVANAPLRIVFSNGTVALVGTTGFPDNIAIYPSREDAYSLDEDGVPHIGPENHAKALFVGSVTHSPETVTYDVDPLEPGTYYVQCDYHPDRLFGTLIVEP
jgi:hypothetical protein